MKTTDEPTGIWCTFDIVADAPATVVQERLDAFRPFTVHDGVVGRRRGDRFWLSTPAIGRQILRPVVHGRLDADTATTLRVRTRPHWFLTAMVACYVPVLVIALLTVTPGPIALVVGLGVAGLLVLRGNLVTYRIQQRTLHHALRAVAGPVPR